MISICGTECCKDCSRLAACVGCEQVDGPVSGGSLIAPSFLFGMVVYKPAKALAVCRPENYYNSLIVSDTAIL